VIMLITGATLIVASGIGLWLRRAEPAPEAVPAADPVPPADQVPAADPVPPAGSETGG
jgi:hypothetical protein